MSIKKIAEKAGVSISTVSRILNRPDYKCSVPGLREKPEKGNTGKRKQNLVYQCPYDTYR